MSNSQITLNFLPLECSDFTFRVYRQPVTAELPPEQSPYCVRQRLPDENEEAYTQFWVSLEPIDGFSAYDCNSFTNPYVTKRYLYHTLKNHVDLEHSKDWEEGKNAINRRLYYTLTSNQVGRRCVWLSPYFLKYQKQFGYLLDFHFVPHTDTHSQHELLENSLAIKDGHPNKDFYSDRYDILSEFIRAQDNNLKSLTDGARSLPLSTQLQSVPSSSLKPKLYLFGDRQTSKSQFLGLKSHGPLEPIDAPNVFFVYRNGDKPLAHDLYRALRGDSFGTFPGMSRMFGLSLGSEQVGGIPIDSFDDVSLSDACARIHSTRTSSAVLPVVVGPFGFDEFGEANTTYYRAKHHFLAANLPSQFVATNTLVNRTTLKWAVGGIALQVFAKLGGTPWEVKPEQESCLIIGIGQSIHRHDNGTDRYLAFSVSTDSSGRYQELRLLGDSTGRDAYLTHLRDSLTQILREYAHDYRRFVLHVTFRPKRDEIEAISESVQSASTDAQDETKTFVVMKFNEQNPYFGFSEDDNSRIPYESTYLPLSNDEYLVWFEGRQWHNPNISKRIERPVNIQFVHSIPRLSMADKKAFLQEAINLSGCNWRGFNSKSMPVSVFYAWLVSRYLKNFDRLGFSMPDLRTLHPWFL